MASTTFTMTGGTITKDGSPNTGVWLNTRTAEFIIDNPVTLSNVFVSVAGNSNGNVSTVYLGGNFDSAEPIKINLYASNENIFNVSWGSTTGGVFLKSLPIEDPTGITQTQLDKFVLNGAYIGTAEKPGTISLNLNGSNYGVAKWTASP
jgi:hypothetical protein